MNFKTVIALPKTARSAQTHKSISFIWIVWSTLHFGTTVDFTIQKFKSSKHLVCLSFLWWQVFLSCAIFSVKLGIKCFQILNIFYKFLFYEMFACSCLRSSKKLKVVFPGNLVICLFTLRQDKKFLLSKLRHQKCNTITLRCRITVLHT